MTDKRWKANERATFALLGGKRTPITGRQRGDAPDGECGAGWEWLCVECKSRQVVPEWLLEGMDQAHAAAKPGQLPVVTVHRVGDRRTGDLVVVRMADFLDWFGGGR